MTLPTPVFERADILSTRRIHERRLHLSPNPVINRIVEYALAYTAGRHQIQLYAHVSLANHQHTVFHDPQGRHPQFRQEFHSLITRSSNRARGVSEAKWSPDRGSPVVLWDENALLDDIAYTIANPCTHHLVDRPEDWPGLVTKIEELAGPSRTIVKPPYFYDPEGELPETVELQYVKPTRLAHWSDDEYRDEIRRRVESKIESARAIRRERGTSVLGRRRILAQDPTDTPSTPAPSGGLSPRVACSLRELRIAVLLWLREFRKLHRAARIAFGKKDRGVLFPFGTYLHRRRYGVDCSTVGPPMSV